jgi:DNA-directed RNA polymerase specialized sigma24 family protein
LSVFLTHDKLLGLKSASALDYIQALYRLAVVRSGSATTAEKLVRDILLRAFGEADRDFEHLDFVGLFRMLLHHAPPPAGTTVALQPASLDALHRLPEPERSALTMLYLEIVTPTASAEILGVSLEQFAEQVSSARAMVATRLPNA